MHSRLGAAGYAVWVGLAGLHKNLHSSSSQHPNQTSGRNLNNLVRVTEPEPEPDSDSGSDSEEKTAPSSTRALEHWLSGGLAIWKTALLQLKD